MAATAKEKGLQDLFLDTLKDVYHAEKQILRAPRQDVEGRADRRAQASLRDAP